MAVGFNRSRVIEALPGESFIYHIGYLPVDNPPQGGLAWKLYREGLVNLVQKRLGPWSYIYMAQRRHLRRSAM